MVVQDGVLKRYVLPGLLLLALSSACLVTDRFLDLFFPAPTALAIEGSSERIGWTPAEASHDLAWDIFLRVNDERATRGLPALVWHEGLADRARRWSEEMIRTGYRHSDPAFRVHPDFVGTGENIAMGPADASVMHVGWMRSDGHRANILRPGYTAMGIGVVCRNDGTMWATQIFGVPQGSFDDDTPTPVEPIVRDDPGPACPVPGLFHRAGG
jgi:hypothetical protein